MAILLFGVFLYNMLVYHWLYDAGVLNLLMTCTPTYFHILFFQL